MRLIDADALYENATDLWDKSDSEDFEKEIFKLILNAPTIDAVEVVRCKDCEYRNEYGECGCNSLYMDMEGDSIGVGFVPEKDFYCAYGKRREDDEA